MDNFTFMIQKIFRLLKNPRPYLENIQSRYTNKKRTELLYKAKSFFIEKGYIKYFSSGSNVEYKPDYLDLINLFKIIIERKPKVILEFGVGFSTIAILLALNENSRTGVNGKLYVVDAEKKWIENTKKKIPKFLKNYVFFNHSEVRINILNGQIVSLFDQLPDISPHIILLDGPNPKSVKGSYKGLKFSSGRSIIAADPLLYESSSPSKFFMIIDGRHKNAEFLKNNLKYKYNINKNTALKRFTFEKL